MKTAFLFLLKSGFLDQPLSNKHMIIKVDSKGLFHIINTRLTKLASTRPMEFPNSSHSILTSMSHEIFRSGPKGTIPRFDRKGTGTPAGLRISLSCRSLPKHHMHYSYSRRKLAQYVLSMYFQQRLLRASSISQERDFSTVDGTVGERFVVCWLR